MICPTCRRLREELDEARETIRQLRATMVDPPWPFYPSITAPGQRWALEQLYRAQAPIPGSVFADRLNLVLRGGKLTTPESDLKVLIHRLRGTLCRLDPRIQVMSRGWTGYWLDEEGKRLVGRLRGPGDAIGVATEECADRVVRWR